MEARQSVAILHITLYPIVLAAASFLVFKHWMRGGRRSWLFALVPVLAVSALRILAAAIEMMGINAPRPTDSNEVLWPKAVVPERIAVFDAVCLGGVLAMMVGMIHRARISLQVEQPGWWIMLLYMMAISCLFVSSVSAPGVYRAFPPDESWPMYPYGKSSQSLRVGHCLFVFGFLFTLIYAIFTLRRLKALPFERRIIFSIIVAHAAIIVRLAYAILAAFRMEAESLFVPTKNTGAAVWTHFGMVSMMELVAVLLCLVVAFGDPMTWRPDREEEDGDYEDSDAESGEEMPRETMRDRMRLRRGIEMRETARGVGRNPAQGAVVRPTGR